MGNGDTRLRVVMERLADRDTGCEEDRGRCNADQPPGHGA